MILLETNKETPSSKSSPLNLSSSDKKTTLSFSELLKGVNIQKGGLNSDKDDKVIQNGALVLSLQSDEKSAKTAKTSTKNDALLSLLKNENSKVKKSEEAIAINPKATMELSSADVKALVFDAKDYLKSKILESDGYKKLQIQELPKTLKGLVEVAKKIGIDISKISVEEIKSSKDNMTSKTSMEVIVEKSASKESLHEPKKITTSDVLNAKTTQKTEVITEAKKVTITDALNIKSSQTKETVADSVKQTDKTIINSVQSDTSKSLTTNESIKTAADVKDGEQKKDVTKTSSVKNLDAINNKTEIKAENSKTAEIVEPRKERVSETSKEMKSIPLFKAQVQSELTTEQLVQTKSNGLLKVEEKSPKTRADETLQLLLRGEKPQHNAAATALTSDFSVATAKVLAPTPTSQTTQSLEKLLRGESSESKSETTLASKTELQSAPKADSFEVKIHEAKQMVKYLSADVKSAIDDYKSPFTRVKVQLNPQRLGEVELTIVQRGKNLHVNLSSNNAAINTLVLNANELRTQLSNSGINNATLNFNNNSDSSNSGGFSGQQHRQNEKQAQKEYSFFDKEDANEEIMNSLEIVVPQYI